MWPKSKLVLWLKKVGIWLWPNSLNVEVMCLVRKMVGWFEFSDLVPKGLKAAEAEGWVGVQLGLCPMVGWFDFLDLVPKGPEVAEAEGWVGVQLGLCPIHDVQQDFLPCLKMIKQQGKLK
jgi:hypothetical protein